MDEHGRSQTFSHTDFFLTRIFFSHGFFSHTDLKDFATLLCSYAVCLHRLFTTFHGCRLPDDAGRSMLHNLEEVELD